MVPGQQGVFKQVSLPSQHRYFSPEDGESMFLRNVGIYRRVCTAPKPRRITSPPRWKPQISQNVFCLCCLQIIKHSNSESVHIYSGIKGVMWTGQSAVGMSVALRIKRLTFYSGFQHTTDYEKEMGRSTLTLSDGSILPCYFMREKPASETSDLKTYDHGQCPKIIIMFMRIRKCFCLQ
jgi:hypothetical protein